MTATIIKLPPSSKRKPVTIVDSGVANLYSVCAALSRIGARAYITSDPVEIKKAERIIIPGVGSAPSAMAKLRHSNLISSLQLLRQPVLGICLGMQVLYERSLEGRGVDTLGIIGGDVKRLTGQLGLALPHMGWNQICLTQKDDPLLEGIPDLSYFYFVHSYRASLSTNTLATCTYGETFSAVVRKDNFYGCQFHPERSGPVGEQFLRNFLGLL